VRYESLVEARRLLQIPGPRLLRLQAQQQAALQLLHARRLGATDAELRAALDGVVLKSLEAVAGR
jgi:hypothetical protein